LLHTCRAHIEPSRCLIQRAGYGRRDERRRDDDRRRDRRRSHRRDERAAPVAREEQKQTELTLVRESTVVHDELKVSLPESGATVGDLRQKAAELCKGKPGFVVTDITLTTSTEEPKKRLFAAMSLSEAGIVAGSKVFWSCRDRGLDGLRLAGAPDPHAGESQKEKLYRLEMEMGGRAPRDPCCDVTLEADQDPLNAREFEAIRKEENRPLLVPKRNPQEYIDLGY